MRMSKVRLLLLFLLLTCVGISTMAVNGCQSNDSFYGQSVVGRWEAPPRGAAGQASALNKQLAGEAASNSRDNAPAGSLPSLDEEVWIIARAKPDAPQHPQAQPQDDQIPGTGVMVTRRKQDGETKNIPLPLKRTDVHGSIHGYIASVDVAQRFHNPYDSKIEAVYVFPLPQNAAVNEFVMTIGKRKIRGIIRDRSEAEQIYKQAKQQGYTASLLTQERPNIFTQKVANIEPQKQIDVNIRYFHTLAYHDGWYQFTFPMVVGPRYNPAGQTDGIGAVARGEHGVSNQHTEVQYLKPGERHQPSRASERRSRCRRAHRRDRGAQPCGNRADRGSWRGACERGLGR